MLSQVLLFPSSLPTSAAHGETLSSWKHLALPRRYLGTQELLQSKAGGAQGLSSLVTAA